MHKIALRGRGRIGKSRGAVLRRAEAAPTFLETGVPVRI